MQVKGKEGIHGQLLHKKFVGKTSGIDAPEDQKTHPRMIGMCRTN